MYEEEIEGTDYKFYVSPQQNENLPDKYGKIRYKDDIDKPFDERRHRHQYPQLRQFAIDYIQKEARAYGLKEIHFPEYEYGTRPQCKLYLSTGFPKNELELTEAEIELNRQQPVLILIQGQDTAPGEWSREVCVKEDFYRGSMLPQLHWAK